MECKHYNNHTCTQTCRCEGVASKCDYTSPISSEDGGSYRFLLTKAMELIHELDEHLTCSLPCIYCKKYDPNTVCDGRFEWIYMNKINQEIGR